VCVISQGASKVLVEQKLESSEGFGKGRKVHTTFGQLVQQLHKGNDSLYLTTQEVSHMHMLLHHPSTVYPFGIANAVLYMVPDLHKHLNALLCPNAAAAAAAIPEVLLLLQLFQVSHAGGLSNALAQAGQLPHAGCAVCRRTWMLMAILMSWVCLSSS